MIAVYRVVNIEAAARGAALPAALVEACSSGFPQRSRAPAALGEAALDSTKTQQQQGAQQQGAPRPTRWRSDTTLSPSFYFSSSTLLSSSSFKKRDASARQHWPFSSVLAHLPAARAGFSSRAGQLWDNLTLPVRQAQLREAKAIAQLLPHRASFFPQFSPHGIQLMPKAVLQQQQQQQVSKGAAAGAAAPAPAPQSTAAVPAKATAAAAPTTQPQRRSSSSTLHDWGAEGDADAAAELDASSKALHRLKLKKQRRMRALGRRRGKQGGST